MKYGSVVHVMQISMPVNSYNIIYITPLADNPQKY
jgi:hypothetical protein